MVTPDFPKSWYQLQPDGSFTFACARGELVDGEATVGLIAEALQTGLLNPEFVKHLRESGGRARVEEYLATRGFSPKLNTRVADFGEVVAAALLEGEERHLQPVRKLRYRETVDWAIRLTDVFTLRLDAEGEIDALCFTSVKAGVTRPSAQTATDGYLQLVADASDAHPEVIGFVSERLYDSGDYEGLARFDRMASRPEQVPRLYRLALIFDGNAWHDDVLATLDANLEPVLPEFKVYLLLASNLRGKVHFCYDQAANRCYVA